MIHSVGSRTWSINWCHFRWPWMTHTLNSRSRHYSTWNISETVQYRHNYDEIPILIYTRLGVILNDVERSWVTARVSTARSVARPLCDSWASCSSSTSGISKSRFVILLFYCCCRYETGALCLLFCSRLTSLEKLDSANGKYVVDDFQTKLHYKFRYCRTGSSPLTWPPHLRCDVGQTGGRGILNKTVSVLQHCVLLWYEQLQAVLPIGLPSWQWYWTGLINAYQFLFSFLFLIFFLFIRCGRLSWLPVSVLLHVEYTLSYRKLSTHINHLEYRVIWSCYTGRWWLGCYIWYSEEGTEWGRSPPRPLLAVPNVTAHPLATIVPITVGLLLYNEPLLCGCNVPIKG